MSTLMILICIAFKNMPVMIFTVFFFCLLKVRGILILVCQTFSYSAFIKYL